MALVTRFPEEVARADLAPSDFEDPDLRALYARLQSGEQPTSDLPAHLAAVAAALGALAPELGDEVEVAQAIEIAALSLRERNLRQRIGETRARLARADELDVGALDGEVAHLAFELAELMKRRERHTVLHPAGAEQREQ